MMRTHTLIRWGGLAAVIASIVSIAISITLMVTIGQKSYSAAALTVEWSLIYALRLAATALLMLGMTALFARQSQKIGLFGVAAFLFASLGTMLVFGFSWTLTFTFPPMAEAVPEFLEAHASEPSIGVLLTLFTVTIGWLLFGVASLRAKILPSGASGLVIVGSLLALVLNMMMAPMSWLVFDLGLIWMGWWLWKDAEE